MRIVHTITSIGRGGSERQLSAIVSNSNDRNHPSQIIYFNAKNSTYINEYNLSKYLIKIDSKNFFIRLFKLNKVLKTNKPDFVYTWGTLDSFLILLLKPFHSFKFINGSIRHGIRLFKFDHLLRSLILWFSPYVIANSNAGLRANNLKPNKKSFVLFNGIDKKFSRRLKGNELAITRMKLFPDLNNPNTLFFISTGNFHKYRDYFTVLDSLNSIKDRCSFHYLIIGDGPLRTEIEQRIAELNLTKSVTLLGLVDDVAEYLKISDVFIHSTKLEGLSNAILEAMFTSLPVIATDVGGIPELYFEKSFRLFKYGDQAKLTKILTNINTEFNDFNPESTDYQKHLSRYKIETMMNHYVSILNSIISNEKK